MFLRISLLLLASCQWGKPVNFNPDFYKASSYDFAIVNGENIHVKCDEPKFDEFACLHKDKIKELAEIIKRARLPKNQEPFRIKLLEEINRATK